jgi:hypothetical protein
VIHRSVSFGATVAVLCALGLVLVACGPVQPASATPTPSPTALDSGIRGIVLLGPVCATAGAESSPCLTPYAAELVITDGAGNVVARVTSSSDGRFQVLLPPGDYVIQPDNGPDGNPSSSPQNVTVTPDEFEDVEIDYDTGE